MLNKQLIYWKEQSDRLLNCTIKDLIQCNHIETQKKDKDLNPEGNICNSIPELSEVQVKSEQEEYIEYDDELVKTENDTN